MPDSDRSLDLLRAVGDLGLREPVATDDVLARVHTAVQHEMELELAGIGRRASAHRPVGSRPPFRRIGRATRYVLTAALIAITAVVAVGAIVLLGNRNRSPIPAGGSAATTHRQLLQTLSILRTGPTPADRTVIACAERFVKEPGDITCPRVIAPAVLIAERPDRAVARARGHNAHAALAIRSYLARLGRPKWDLALIRTVPLSGSGPTAVRFFPGTWQSPPRSAQRSAGILATLVYRGRTGPVTSPFFERATVAALRAHGLAVPIFVASPKQPGHNLAVIIVPDGVARISIGTVSLEGRPSMHWRENVTATVHDNIATLPLNTPTFQIRCAGSIGPRATIARMTWFDLRGGVVRHTTIAIQLYVYFKPVEPPAKCSR